MKVTTTYSNSNQAMKFPTVTFCNSNRVATRRLHAYVKENPIGNKTESEVIESIQVKDTHAFSQQLDEFIIGEYEFNKALKPANSTDSFYFYPTLAYGNCFVFNYNSSKYQAKPGYQYGLHVVIDIDQDSYYPEDFELTLKPAGVLVSLQNEFYKPNMDNAILASPNQLTRIAVSKSTISRLKAPYDDNCRERADKSKDEFPMLTSEIYSQQQCNEACLVFKMNKTCGAIDFENFLVVKASNFFFRIGSSLTELECIIDFTNKFHQNLIPCYCPPLCYEESFLYSTNTALWPSKIAEEGWVQLLLKRKQKNITKEYIRQNLVAIQIFYESFKTMETVHAQSYTFASLMAESGGILSLYIGASIFSLIEFAIFLIEVIVKVISKVFKLKKLGIKIEAVIS